MELPPLRPAWLYQSLNAEHLGLSQYGVEQRENISGNSR